MALLNIHFSTVSILRPVAENRSTVLKVVKRKILHPDQCSGACVCQVFKSTADVDGGRALYEGYSAVSDSGAHNFLRLRETVLQRKEDRKMFVQANSRINGRWRQQQRLR